MEENLLEEIDKQKIQVLFFEKIQTYCEDEWLKQIKKKPKEHNLLEIKQQK